MFRVIFLKRIKDKKKIVLLNRFIFLLTNMSNIREHIRSKVYFAPVSIFLEHTCYSINTNIVLVNSYKKNIPRGGTE